MIRRLFLVVVFTIGLNFLAWADLDEGIAAFNRGDYETALRELRPLAEQGDPEAQRTLGMSYFLGMGVAQDKAEAVKWYRRAAMQGHADAQSYLGNLYKWDLNYSEAAKWYRRAAKQGHARAQLNLGVLYGNGTGVPQDFVLGYFWYTLAKAQGEALAPALDPFTGEITRSQIAEAERLAREWRPKPEVASTVSEADADRAPAQGDAITSQNLINMNAAAGVARAISELHEKIPVENASKCASGLYAAEKAFLERYPGKSTKFFSGNIGWLAARAGSNAVISAPPGKLEDLNECEITAGEIQFIVFAVYGLYGSDPYGFLRRCQDGIIAATRFYSSLLDEREAFQIGRSLGGLIGSRSAIVTYLWPQKQFSAQAFQAKTVEKANEMAKKSEQEAEIEMANLLPDCAWIGVPAQETFDDVSTRTAATPAPK